MCTRIREDKPSGRRCELSIAEWQQQPNRAHQRPTADMPSPICKPASAISCDRRVFGPRWIREPKTGWEVHLLVQLSLSAVLQQRIPPNPLLDSGVSRVGRFIPRHFCQRHELTKYELMARGNIQQTVFAAHIRNRHPIIYHVQTHAATGSPLCRSIRLKIDLLNLTKLVPISNFFSRLSQAPDRACHPREDGV